MQQILDRGIVLLDARWANWRAFAPLLWVALLLALAPYQALSRDLWTDESFTVSYTAHPSLGMLLEDVRKNEQTPPVYFTLSWLWSRVAGQSDVSQRLLSLLFGALAVVILAVMAQRWLPALEARVAGFLLAVLTPVGIYVATARSYAFMLLMTVICIAAFEWLYRRPTHIPALIAYSLAMGVFCLTSYFAAAFVVAHNLLWLAGLLRRREGWLRRLVGWSIAQIAIVLIVLPWLPALAYQFQTGDFVTATENVTAIEYFWQLYSLLAAPPASLLWLAIWLPLTMLLWALVVAGLRQSGQRDGGLVLRAFGVPLITQMSLIIWMHAVGWRYLTVLIPGAVLAVALGIGALRRQLPRPGMALLAALVLGMLVYRVFGVPGPAPTRSWPELVAVVESRIDPAHDAVLIHPPWEQRTFEHYYRGAPLKLYGAHHYDDFFMTEGHDFGNPWTAEQVAKAFAGSRRAWVFYNPTNGLNELRLPYKAIETWQAGKLELTLYDLSAAQQ